MRSGALSPPPLHTIIEVVKPSLTVLGINSLFPLGMRVWAYGISWGHRQMTFVWPECPALITFSHVNICRLQEVVELNFLFRPLCRNPPTDSLLNGVPYPHCVRLNTSRKWQEDLPVCKPGGLCLAGVCKSSSLYLRGSGITSPNPWAHLENDELNCKLVFNRIVW